MPFPESNREIYERNPLTEVICQLRFPTVLRITADESALAELQERLRGAYPIFREEAGRAAGIPAEVSQMLGELPVQLRGEPTYAFDSEDGTRTITVGREFFSVIERSYRRWELLQNEIALIKNAVEEIYSPSFYARIGLRYQDVIDREELGLADRPWHELVKPPMAGLLGSDSDVREAVTELVCDAELVVSEVNGGSVRLRHGLATRGESENKIFAMDADFFTNERSDPDDVFKTLAIFNRCAGHYFRWSITDALRDALGPSVVDDAQGDVAST
jgi:uncharacterized protein (TIGR04255 family)